MSSGIDEDWFALAVFMYIFSLICFSQCVGFVMSRKVVKVH